MSDIAISARGIAKSYIIRHNASDHVTLAETVLARLKNPLRRAQKETFWALNDITFDVKQGDVVGVIGRNGAGKSTLLKILSRITKPSKGEIHLHGRVGSLLEVGTGFHPDLTGRENIYLNGAILGMRKSEIRKQFDAIVDFAGVEQFLDTPVKRYSSGMYVRLAFAVAAHLRSEILVVDEVLAVGDTEFQNKCLGKMHDVATSGRTVLFVSHHMQNISVLCNKAIYLEKGVCKFSGDVSKAIDYYVNTFKSSNAQTVDPDRRGGSGEYRFLSASPAKISFDSDEEKIIRFTLARRRPRVGKIFFSFLLFDSRGSLIAHIDSRLVGFEIEPCEIFHGEFRLRGPWLKPGEYRLDMRACSFGVLDHFEQACIINISELMPYSAHGTAELAYEGVILPDFGFTEGQNIE